MGRLLTSLSAALQPHLGRASGARPRTGAAASAAVLAGAAFQGSSRGHVPGLGLGWRSGGPRLRRLCQRAHIPCGPPCRSLLEELKAGIEAAQAEAAEKRRIGDPRQSYEVTAKVRRAATVGRRACCAPVALPPAGVHQVRHGCSRLLMLAAPSCAAGRRAQAARQQCRQQRRRSRCVQQQCSGSSSGSGRNSQLPAAGTGTGTSRAGGRGSSSSSHEPSAAGPAE